MRETWGSGILSVLDVSRGIGTQALGLAKSGYEVTASDLSPDEVRQSFIPAKSRLDKQRDILAGGNTSKQSL